MDTGKYNEISGSENGRKKIDVSKVEEISFQHKHLTVDTVQSRLCKLTSATALDLSFNKMIGIPKGLPHGLVALNLSFNMVTAVESVYRVNNLIELSLSHNQLTSCRGFSTAVSLQYLDLGFNQIKRVEGLENLLHLKQLNLEGNLIGGQTAIRSLYLNRSLTNLNLLKNVVASSKHFSLMILDLLPQLDIVNNEYVQSTRKNRRSASNMAGCRVSTAAKSKVMAGGIVTKSKVITGASEVVSPVSAPSPIFDTYPDDASSPVSTTTETVGSAVGAGVRAPNNTAIISSYAAQFEAQQNYAYASSQTTGAFQSHQMVVPPYSDAAVASDSPAGISAALAIRQPMHTPNLHVTALTHAEKIRKEKLEAAEKKRWLLQLQLEQQEDEEAQEAANRSSLPWRNPPHPLPRGWDSKSKQLSTPNRAHPQQQLSTQKQHTPNATVKGKKKTDNRSNANHSTMSSKFSINPISPDEKKYYYQQVIDQNISQQSRDDIFNESYRSHVPDNNGNGGIHSVDVSPYRKASFSDKKTTWMSPVLHKQRATASHPNAVHEQDYNKLNEVNGLEREQEKPEHLQSYTYHRDQSMATPFATNTKLDGNCHHVRPNRNHVYDQDTYSANGPSHSGRMDQTTNNDLSGQKEGFPQFNQYDRANEMPLQEVSLDDSLWCTAAFLEQISGNTDPIFAGSNKNLYDEEEGRKSKGKENKDGPAGRMVPDGAVAFGRRAVAMGTANPGQRGSMCIPVTPTAASMRRLTFNQDKIMLEKEKMLDDLSRRPENKNVRPSTGRPTDQKFVVEVAAGKGTDLQQVGVLDAQAPLTLNTSLSCYSSHLSHDAAPPPPPPDSGLAGQLSIEIPDRKFQEVRAAADKYGKKYKVGAYSDQPNKLGNPAHDHLNFSAFSDAACSDAGTIATNSSQCLTPRTTTGPQKHSQYHSSATNRDVSFSGDASFSDDFYTERKEEICHAGDSEPPAALLGGATVVQMDPVFGGVHASALGLPHTHSSMDHTVDGSLLSASSLATGTDDDLRLHPASIQQRMDHATIPSPLTQQPAQLVKPISDTPPSGRSHILTESSRIAAALQSLLTKKKTSLDVMSQT